MSNANLYQLIEQRIPADRTAACLQVPGERDISWGDLHATVGRIGALLTGLRLAPGSRLVAQVEKSP
ncbi:MAG TPA: malonyl-CoA synthase, partial [Burkholderiaceae bacterium]